MPSAANRSLSGALQSLIAVLVVNAVLLAGGLGDASYTATCDDPGWDAIFSTFGLSRAEQGTVADIAIACGSQQQQAQVLAMLPRKLVVLVGDSPLARGRGVVPIGGPATEVRNVRDLGQPELLIVWKEPLPLVPVTLPASARVLAEDRWTGQPLVALLPQSSGAAMLWIATDPGELGYERFPFLGSSLLEAGFVPPFRTRNLWAFFDSAYRHRADPEFLASRWQQFGIAVLHVSAWQHWEREADRDAWLHRLIRACHRRGILVYAWFEFPHVSEEFWASNPQCREKTALGQDAQLDWRKLINLADADCAAKIKHQTTSLLEAFHWDGVNLAEIYYESLEGIANPARFTPMNQTVRDEFAARAGFDPAELFRESSERHHQRDPEAMRAFLDYRRDKVTALHEEWLRFFAEASGGGGTAPHVIVTQIDDRFDTSIRDNLGVDSSQLLSLMHQYPFTLLVEDPATVWHLGAERYPAIARAYLAESAYPERLAIDINIFPRYQEVYPTKQQTGMELYRLVRSAMRSFPRVALYFEHTLSAAELPLLAAAAIPDAELRNEASRSATAHAVRVQAAAAVGIRWQGPALVNGRPWAARDDGTLWLPKGSHLVESAEEDPPLRMQYLGGELLQVHSQGNGVLVHYRSEGRVFAGFSTMPGRISLDGEHADFECHQGEDAVYCLLPAGEHLVHAEAPAAALPTTERSHTDAGAAQASAQQAGLQ
jgi:hypothetical protein